MENFFLFFYIFILSISFLSYLLLCNSLFSYIYSLHPDNYFISKITNWIYTITMSFVYILLYILFFYCLRVYNLYTDNILDLKNVFFFVQNFIDNLHTEWYFILFLALFFIIFLLIIMLIIAKIHQIFSLEVYKLFFFFTCYAYISIHSFRLYDKMKYVILPPIGSEDLITYFFRKFMDFYSSIFDIPSKVLERRKINPNYKYWATYPIYKWSRNFISFSPLVPFIFDCVYNNFILSHFYYYLTLYIPLMLIKRIITNINCFPVEAARHLWLIYYRDDNSYSKSSLKNAIYLASPVQREIFNTYFSLDFSIVSLKGQAVLEHMALQDNLFWGFRRFEQDDKNDNIYWNGFEYVMKVNNSYYTVLRDPNSESESYPDWDDPSVTILLGEEWYFIEDDIKKRLHRSKIERFILGYFNYKLDLEMNERFPDATNFPPANPNWWKVFSKKNNNNNANQSNK